MFMRAYLRAEYYLVNPMMYFSFLNGNVWYNSGHFASTNFNTDLYKWSHGQAAEFLEYNFDLYNHGFLTYCALSGNLSWNFWFNGVITPKDHMSKMGTGADRMHVQLLRSVMKGANS